MFHNRLFRSLPVALAMAVGAGTADGQTTLVPGDLAIVGINANNSCLASTADEISFICFQNIATNTQIDITDNGYERQFAGQWGEGEGRNRFIRTGPMIPAGTVITFRINGLVLPTMVSPDAAWTILAPIGTSVNMNAMGDQLFFTQGGVWTDPVGANNTTYSGSVLYAFNTKNVWNSFANDTKDSGLPPGSLCFSMNPTSASDYVKFTDAVLGGTFTARTQRAWLIDFDNPANWTTYANCSAYNSSAPNYLGTVLLINPSSFQNGLWTGAKTQDWFDCRNWDDAEVPNAASNVVVNQSRTQDCQVGINGTTPLTAQCATLQVSSTSGVVSPQLSINNGRQLVVSGTTTINRTVAGTPVGINLNNGSFTTASLTLLGNTAGALNAQFVNPSTANGLQVNGDVLILNGGRLDLANAGLNLTGNFRSMDAAAGATAFTETNSQVLFNGAGPQAILTAGFQESFHTLRVNNASSDLSLNAPIKVNATLDLIQGRIFSTAANLLSIGGLGTTTNASDASFVSGPVEKVGTANITFPIGKDGSYRPAALTGITGLATDAFVAEYFPALPPNPPAVLFGPGLDPTLDHISACEYWQIDRSVGTPNAFVTLSWDAASSCGVTLPADLRVARWNGALWEDRGNGGTTGTLLSGTVISGLQQTSFSPWTLASVSAQNPLPIELMYFLARPDGDAVKLDWATASELNNDRFTVERSADGVVFAPVLSRPGAGNSSSVIEYSDHDRAPLPGVSYYRLRQTDLDGSSTVSPIVAVQFDGASPASLQVLYGTDELIAVHGFSTGGRYEITDLMGQVVRSGAIIQEGRTALAVDDLAHGAYVLRLSDGHRVESAQFVR